MSFFISNAWADTVTTASTTAPAGNSLPSILMLVGFVVIFYLMLWRPQAKRAKEHRTLLSNLAVGDEVMTSGGILGKIAKLDDDFITLVIAPNVEIKVQKGSVANVLPKGTLKS